MWLGWGRRLVGGPLLWLWYGVDGLEFFGLKRWVTVEWM